MPKQERKAPKGLPKRVGNVRAKERRHASWARCQIRKEARRVAAAEHSRANRRRIERGEPSSRDVRRENRRTIVVARAARGPVPTAPRIVTRRPTARVPAVGAALIRHARNMMDNGHDLPFHYRYSNLSKVV